MQQTFLPYSKSKKQVPRLLTAWHSLQAKSLCELLIQRGIPLKDHDVAWHSPEVMLKDVKGQMAERFLLKKYVPPKCG
jgi:hypothetical protein